MRAFAVKGEYAVYAGKVTEAGLAPDKEQEKRYVITLENYKGDKKAFWFTNDHSVTPPRLNADRAEKANVQVGDFVIIKGFKTDENETSCTAFEVRKQGIMRLADEKRPVNVIIGTAIRPREPKDGMYCVTMAVRTPDADGNWEDRWYDITFFNGSKDDASAPNGKREWKNADHAKKAMGDNEKAKVAIVVGESTERAYNGKLYYSFVGTSITRQPD